MDLRKTDAYMRGALSIGVALITAGLLRSDVDCYAGINSHLLSARSSEQVDVELVLAVDISFSMDPDELALQREGYARAITSAEFLGALRNGPQGRIAIAYFEWASQGDQRIAVPWTIIDGERSAAAVAAEILKWPVNRGSRTSISGAIDFAAKLLSENNFQGLRQVIDVSGDGPNNHGDLVPLARDNALKQGIVINGLPIMLKRPSTAGLEIEDLDIYFEDCVIGGPSAFVIPVKERSKFAEAIRTKLVQEVASREASGATSVSAEAPRMSCTTGEQLWRDRWGQPKR